MGFKSNDELNFQSKMLSALIAGSLADIATHPLDTLKVRHQVHGENKSLKHAADHLVKMPLKSGNILLYIYRTEGLRAMYNGVLAGLQRQMCVSPIRIGMYDSVRSRWAEIFSNLGLSSRNPLVYMISGLTTGCMAVLVAQPTEVVKVRFQAQRPGQVRLYPTIRSAYTTILRVEGVLAFWAGTKANLFRSGITTCVELASYQMIKENLIACDILTDNVPCHFISGMAAGITTAICANPVDVIKTRLMNSPTGTYSGVIDCMVTMGKNEGVAAFYKGLLPSGIRMGIWNIIMFVCYEQLKLKFQSIGT